MRSLRLVTDGPQGSFVCTWCASLFSTKEDLARHRDETPECGVNQTVSNPLTTKYSDAGVVATRPGEYTLHRVRAPTCPHTVQRDRLTDVAGDTIGWQCSYCYSVLPDDL